MKKIICILMGLMVLNSCIGIKNHVKINKDLSGTMAWVYTIDNSIYQLGKLGEQTKELPFPVLKKDFEKACESIDGLSLKSYELKETDQEILIKASVSFAQISLLNKMSALPESEIQWNVSEKKLGLNLGFKSSLVLDEDDKTMLSEFLGDYSLSFEIETPTPLVSANFGTMSSDKRKLLIDFSYLEALELKDDYLEISWQ